MRAGGKINVGLLAVLGLLALPATAAASTTFTVNSETDAPLESGASTCESNDAAKDCTLLAAVALAGEVSSTNSGETVTVEVPGGKYENTLGTTGGLRVAEHSNLVIDGAGAGKTIIDGGGVAVPVIELEEDASLVLKGVTVQHGVAGYGGGISVDGFDELTVEQAAIEHDEGSELGGGVYIGSPAYVEILDSTVAHDRASYSGGGVFAESGSEVFVQGSTVDENSAGFYGGGVAAELVGEDSDCGLADHSSKPRAKTASVEGEPPRELMIEQSTIDTNTARYGGGVAVESHNEDSCGDAAGHASSKAAARGRTASVHARPAFSGYEEPDLAILQTAIAYNRAEEEDDGGYGGGIWESGGLYDPIVNTTIADNFATWDGGGVYAADGDYEALISDTVFDNTLEPEIEIQARHLSTPSASSSRAAGAHPAVEGQIQPGSNLDVEEESESEIGLRNTIVAESGGQQNCQGEIYGELGGYNLDYPSTEVFDEPYDSCGLEEEHNLRGVNPLLEEELKNNGGPTDTLALTAASPAIGYVPIAGDCEEPASGFGPAMLNEKDELKPVDQRGEKRPGLPGRECDIGAYEYEEPAATPAPVVTPPPPPATIPNTSVLPFKVSAPALCTSKRDITIHIQNVKQFGIVSAVVSIDGKHKRTLTGRRLRTAINLRGLPTGTFTIEIVARTNSGHKLTGRRVYHTCHGKLPGHSYLPL